MDRIHIHRGPELWDLRIARMGIAYLRAKAIGANCRISRTDVYLFEEPRTGGIADRYFLLTPQSPHLKHCSQTVFQDKVPKTQIRCQSIQIILSMKYKASIFFSLLKHTRQKHFPALPATSF